MRAGQGTRARGPQGPRLAPRTLQFSAPRQMALSCHHRPPQAACSTASLPEERAPRPCGPGIGTPAELRCEGGLRSWPREDCWPNPRPGALCSSVPRTSRPAPRPPGLRSTGLARPWRVQSSKTALGQVKEPKPRLTPRLQLPSPRPFPQPAPTLSSPRLASRPKAHLGS